LQDYQILDTLPESDFDDIVKLASAICGAPVSLISFVDADRQWFKAETGFGQSETSLQKSICAHALHEEEFLEIRDARDDLRAQDNPLVRVDGGVRFYAGALLKSEEGVPLGTLCVLDYEPRSLNAVQRDALRVLARQVMTLLETR
ncbi:GAF domain-containing protein, partial [Thioclava sp. BHET1]